MLIQLSTYRRRRYGIECGPCLDVFLSKNNRGHTLSSCGGGSGTYPPYVQTAATEMHTVAGGGGGAVVHPVPRTGVPPSLAADADTTEECFICAKSVSQSTRVASDTVQRVECDCLAHNTVHQACFDEWFNKEGTCPLCRSVCAETAAIRLHIRETVATVQQEAEEMVRRKNRRLVVVGALSVCVMLCVFAFLLLHQNPDHPEDDDWQHTHDDDHAKAASAHMHTQGTTPGVWHLSR